jgi:serine/threonine-protein kinase RsbT
MTMLQPVNDDRNTFAVARATDAYLIPGRIKETALEFGFDEKSAWEIEIAASELVDNVIRYAGTGTVAVERIHAPRSGLRLIVDDDGPGIENIDLALIDGFSQGVFTVHDGRRIRHSLGVGLGAVHRLMSAMTIVNKPEGGLRVTADKWLREDKPKP